MNIWKNKDIKNALVIGLISSFAYLICYFARNILSVVSPQMISENIVDEAFIGTLSTVNMWVYACGQLVNGIIGDKMKAKYLVSAGLFFSGIANVFIGLSDIKAVMLISYGLVGFFLSMIYAPLTKLIAENTRPKYAVNCCLGLTLASLMGVPVAGIAALVFEWDAAFVVGGIVMAITGALFFATITILEKKKIVTYETKEKTKTMGGGVKALLENQIIRFSLVSILTGIVRTSVTFWIPTYLSQYLHYSTGMAATIYTVMTCVRSVAPYVGNLVLYQRVFKRNMNTTICASFAASAISFVLMFLVKVPLLNIAFLCLALMAESVASNILWSIYCPSLRDTGMVSSATGYLDFLSYAAAGTANLIFANAIATIGWGKLIIVWAVLMGAGVLVTAQSKKRRK